LYAAGAYSALGENDLILDGIRQFSSPQLDHNLVNFHGIPILSYRIEELDQQLSAEDEDEMSFLSVRQQRIMALIYHQIQQHTEILASISDHLKRSSLFYESQNLHEYRMHPAWIDPAFSNDEEYEAIQVEQIYRLDKLNLHILLSEDVIHSWNDLSSNEAIQAIFYDIGIIPQKFHIEYHYLSAASTEQYLLELFERIQNQPHEISLIIAGDSEIDQEIIDEKFWGKSSYIPAEFISSCCLAHPELQLMQQQPLKTFKLVSNQNNLDQIFKELDIHDLPQYQAEEPFVLVVEDSSDVKAAKKLQQFFTKSPVEPHHYLYCKPIFGHTQNVAKLFGLMLGAHFSEQQVAFVYGQNLQAFIQAVPEITQDQGSIALAD
jgi:2-hydroxy-3-keto-5-methylthiopentenyl-1-phosphate phosphatase